MCRKLNFTTRVQRGSGIDGWLEKLEVSLEKKLKHVFIPEFPKVPSDHSRTPGIKYQGGWPLTLTAHMPVMPPSLKSRKSSSCALVRALISAEIFHVTGTYNKSYVGQRDTCQTVNISTEKKFEPDVNPTDPSLTLKKLPKGDKCQV